MTHPEQELLAGIARDIENGRFGAAETQLEKFLKQRPENLRALYLQSCVFAATGRLDPAIDVMKTALRGRGDVPVFHIHLAEMYRLKRDYFAAVGHAERAVAISGGDPAHLMVLGRLQAELGRFQDAAGNFRQALRRNPRDVEAVLSLAQALLMLDQTEAAEIEFRRAIAIDQQREASHEMHAAALSELKPHQKAMAALLSAAGENPSSAEYWRAIGELHMQLGQMAEARESFQTALKIDPRSVNVLAWLAPLSDEATREDLLRQIEHELASTGSKQGATHIARLHFTLFKIYEDLGRFDEAFVHLIAANAFQRKTIAYDEAGELRKLEKVKEIFSKAAVREKSGGGYPSDVPIFILGMPRSGSTLVEQILASHPSVIAGGELNLLGDIATGAFREFGASEPYPFFLPRATALNLSALGGLYSRRLKELHPHALRVTDKMPVNVNFLGLIHLALPRAKIILTSREPLDICLSCFSMPFAGDALNYTYDLGELGRYYCAYSALVDHWKTVLPDGAFLTVRYENVVADFEAQARRLLEYCELPWDSRVLEFQKADRPVRTASVVQVRKPLYKSSVKRWEHYAKFLGPLKAELDRLT